MPGADAAHSLPSHPHVSKTRKRALTAIGVERALVAQHLTALYAFRYDNDTRQWKGGAGRQPCQFTVVGIEVRAKTLFLRVTVWDYEEHTMHP